MTEPDWAALEAAWRPARAAGVLGRTTIEELVAHAAGYLPAACRVQDEFRGVDLGTGAGVPGLLLALARPRSQWLLVDASEKRCDLAEKAARAVQVHDRVTVRHARAEEVAQDPEWRGTGDLVVARSFGPPAEVGECGLPLVAPSGQLVVSVNEATEREWRAATDSRIPFSVVGSWQLLSGRFLALAVSGSVGEEMPRRPAARARRPLF